MPQRQDQRKRPTPEILVYGDRGVSAPLLRCLLHELRLAARPGVRIETVQAKHLRRPNTLGGARLLIIPGGRDLPYCQELDGDATTHIRAFVHAGGSFLGLCAGAYFACRSVEYAGQSHALPFPGSRTDAGVVTPPIAGPRRLTLIPAEARINADATDLAAAQLNPMSPDLLDAVGVVAVEPQGELRHLLPVTEPRPLAALHWLGPRICEAPPQSDEFHALATDPRGNTTIARALHGRGVAIACGLHPEVSAGGFRETLIDLAEGGIPYDPARAATILWHLHERDDARRLLFRAILIAADISDLLDQAS